MEHKFTHEGKLGFEAFNDLVKFLDNNSPFTYYLKRDYTLKIITYNLYNKDSNEFIIKITLNDTIEIKDKKISIKI
jgi:hypothetical protein